MKTIRIECTGASAAPYKRLTGLQGDLKVLTDESFKKFKKNLLKNGFSEPIAVWRDTENEELRIVNGHQRLATVKRLVENEGYTVEELPISYVEAKDLQEAKRKVLALTSEYGQLSDEGLLNFLADMDLDEEFLREAVSLRGVNVDEVIESWKEVALTLGDVDPLDVDAMDQPVQKDDLGDGSGRASQATSGLRLVQIFLRTDELDEFRKMVDAIQDREKLDNITDTIRHAVKATYENNRTK